ncbi:DUF502 domain-containing protein [Litorimonas sp. WD9-15]|uniref:DUF502 domain-containing protein n=1 Tax=Litorimonas sp. WD9-15 TaxID=3418716 RepID=UPI003CFE70A3
MKDDTKVDADPSLSKSGFFYKPDDVSKFSLLKWLRNRFFTGVVVAIPIVTTLLVVSWVVQKVDNNVFKIIPDSLNPETYLGFAIPGLGLIISIILLFLLGIIASNFIGKSLIRSGESLLDRVPVVSPVYNALKQIVQTVAAQKDRAFRDVCLLEYPRKGVWALGFVTADLGGEAKRELGDNMVCVFVPTTPNPTSGFLLFLQKGDIKILDMTPEEGAKMIISGGMVSSRPDSVLDAGGGVDMNETEENKTPIPSL